MIVNAIELKKKIHLGDLLKGEPTYQGNPGDYLVTTVNGNQGIIPKEIFKEIVSQSFGVVERTTIVGLLIGDSN